MKTENVWKTMTKELHKICGIVIHRKSLGRTQSNMFLDGIHERIIS
jgi:hypothetical protein